MSQRRTGVTDQFPSFKGCCFGFVDSAWQVYYRLLKSGQKGAELPIITFPTAHSCDRRSIRITDRGVMVYLYERFIERHTVRYRCYRCWGITHSTVIHWKSKATSILTYNGSLSRSKSVLKPFILHHGYLQTWLKLHCVPEHWNIIEAAQFDIAPPLMLV